MSYGLEIYTSAGQLMFSSDNQGGLYVGQYSLAPSTYGTFVFNGTNGLPNMTGYALRALIIGAGSHNITVNAVNPPSITVTQKALPDIARGRNTVVMVFAK